MGSYAFAESLNLWSLSDWSQATTLRTYHLAVIPSVAFTESLGAQAAPQVHSSGLCARLYLLLGSLRRPWRLTRKNQSGLHTLQQGDLPPMQLDRCHAAMQVPIDMPSSFLILAAPQLPVLCQKLGALEGHTTFQGLGQCQVVHRRHQRWHVLLAKCLLLRCCGRQRPN